MKKNITQHVSHARSIAKLLLMLSIFSVHILSAQTIVEKIVNEENNKGAMDEIATLVAFSALQNIKDASMNAVKLITL